MNTEKTNTENIDTRVLLQDSNMSLVLDTYVDIFSSFDPRPYAERSLSDDFLDECKKLVMDKGIDIIELRLMMPESNREIHNEEIIKKRLHSYFLQQAHVQGKKIRKDIFKGRVFVITGIIIGLIVSYVLHTYAFAYMYTTLITVIGEPASWLMIWTGADKLLQYFWGDGHSNNYIHRLSRAKIHFYGY